MATLRLYEAAALLFLGDLRHCRDVFEAEARGQAEQGNVRGGVILPLATRAHHLALADDRPAEARRRIREAVERWGQAGFGAIHLQGWWGELDVLLYEGRAAEAWAHCEAAWGQATRTDQTLVELVRLLTDWARARCAVARAAGLDPAARAPLLGEASRRARRLERMRGLPVAAPHAGLIRAAVAHQAGRPADALRHLDRAEAAFASAGMALYVAAARRRRGELTGDIDLVAAADAAMAARGVVDPPRFADLYAPGFPRPQ